MTKRHRKIVDHSFHGGRFADHGVDLDVLPDLLRYRDLLVELAKELWKRRNPTRQNLPPGFAESLALRFYSVNANCATIPLERLVTVPEHPLVPDLDRDELDDAVDLVSATIDAVREGRLLPEAFPKRLLNCFSDYGRSLRLDEWIEHRTPRRAETSRYDLEVRERIVQFVNAAYEDFVDTIGTVTMARVNKPKMSLELADAREIDAAFRPEDEDTITTALKQHTKARLQVVGRGRYSADGILQRITEVSSVRLLLDGEIPFDSSARPIWEEFAEIIASVPRETFACLPHDSAERHDYYIHGQAQESP